MSALQHLHTAVSVKIHTAVSVKIFEVLEADIAKYSTLGQCLIAGDFNAGTNLAPDYCLDNSFDQLNNIDTTNVMSIDEETDTLPPRCNMDSSKVDEHGQQLLSLCRSSGLHILNDRTIGDTLGMCTCYSYTGSPSVIDCY